MTIALALSLAGALAYALYELNKRRSAELSARSLRANLDHCRMTSKVLKDKLSGARDARNASSKRLIELQKRIAEDAPELAAALLRERLRANSDGDGSD